MTILSDLPDFCGLVLTVYSEPVFGEGHIHEC